MPNLVLGLDYGVKKMGMSLGNTLTHTARPFDILPMNNGQPIDWDNLIGMIKTWQISTVVVGLPLNMDGTYSVLTRRAHKFARRLAHRLLEQKVAAAVMMFDERLTSVAAKELAWEHGLISDNQDPIDDLSACLLLISYFNDPNHAQNIGLHVEQTIRANAK